MSNARLFDIANAVALAGWLCLLIAPRWRRTAVLVARLVAAMLCGGYVAMLGFGLAGEGPPEGAGFTSLQGVRLLLSSEAALLAGWVHYLAFDLWAGSWEVEDAGAGRVPHLLVIPCLLLTFVAGPAGLLLYLVIYAARR
ncbi:hypothetical protein GCM10007973_15420 [Polymorphobacter multimanifer]|uniref:DUF4281 domain-containing protein n=1 Tax=Polymorphobacter multimanifer TaxID=1070431 RepID=A0A841L092_9SPHN|nr:ABA4-like family protein [Polymorphobacter multimanifer]MBB6226239.1 hypothetical protein [Polymorphobacter multimanifer]GGI79756.1 hypothetical protein GCM10007973_15420 [Polymorphobacter multimanifer]